MSLLSTGAKAALIFCAVVIAFVFVVWRCLLIWARRAYNSMIAANTISVDSFVQSKPSARSCLKCVLMHRFNVGSKKPNYKGLELTATKSDKVDGLIVTKKAGPQDKTLQSSSSNSTSAANTKLPPLVVGTIRMGFGHHRIAYATSSWGLDSKSGRDVYFHDLLNIDSEEATMIHEMDKKYSKGSRLASELGGVVESFWGSLTKAGDEDSLRVTYQMAEYMRPIISGLDKKSPIIASHSLVAAAAVAAGFQNVINLVIDNHAQWFVVVPGALNLVQGPSNYHNFLKMGVPSDQLQIAGHWCPEDLVTDIPNAVQRRKDRALSNPRKPLRLLIPVGGAGAQRFFVSSLIQACAPLVKENKVQLFLNAGDHPHMKEAFLRVLDENQLEFNTVDNMENLKAFKNQLMDPKAEPSKNVTLFAYDDYFTAVATTDILCNVADVLTCKPSELAFYPIPKLMIRRVGDHEAYSALRASEVGDGTLEAREIVDAMRYIDLFIQTPELLVEFNNAIEKNNSIGIYDGCKNAVRIAFERAAAMT
mmetsp:Transcript_28909/g.41425  ORF Transcript_28909/g.41425 Transcript_28909/m.41425 type:complete len:534 (-) Transcript_28909:129-1730(-)